MTYYDVRKHLEALDRNCVSGRRRGNRVVRLQDSSLPDFAAQHRRLYDRFGYPLGNTHGMAASVVNAHFRQATIRHVGRLPIFPPVRDEDLTFDIDEVSLPSLPTVLRR